MSSSEMALFVKAFGLKRIDLGVSIHDFVGLFGWLSGQLHSRDLSAEDRKALENLYDVLWHLQLQFKDGKTTYYPIAEFRKRIVESWTFDDELAAMLK